MYTNLFKQFAIWDNYNNMKTSSNTIKQPINISNNNKNNDNKLSKEWKESLLMVFEWFLKNKI